jgi:hypothetical protein
MTFFCFGPLVDWVIFLNDFYLISRIYECLALWFVDVRKGRNLHFPEVLFGFSWAFYFDFPTTFELREIRKETIDNLGLTIFQTSKHKKINKFFPAPGKVIKIIFPLKKY